MRLTSSLMTCLLVLGIAAPAAAQCGDPDNLLTGDDCGFDASVGSWTSLPQATPWDPNWGTIEHTAATGHTNPGALLAIGGENADPFGNYWAAGATVCIPHATVPGDVIEYSAWAQIDADPASLLFPCAVNVTTTNATCDAGLDYQQTDFTPTAATVWTQVNPGGDTLTVATGGDAIAYQVSCWASAPLNLTIDDASVAPYVPPVRTFEVTVRGTVEWNQVTAPPLGNAAAGDPVEMTFRVTSDSYVDGTTYPTRGYIIDHDSFVMTLGSATIGLQNPFPAGLEPYFAIRNDDPAVDGFMLVLDPDAGWPTGIYLDQVGILENFLDNFYVTYDGTALDSLDIAGATGSWGFDGLEVYNWTVDDAGFNAIGIMFTGMTIAEVLFEDDFESGDLSAWSESVVGIR